MRRQRRSSATPAAILAAGLGFVAAGAAAQEDYRNDEDFSSEKLYATGDIGLGARAMGLAGAYIAVADDATALLYNPAGLAQMRRIEVAFGLRHQHDRSTHGMFGVEAEATTRRTGLDHLAFAYPFPTYRGSLVTGIGLFRVRSNDLDVERHDRVVDGSQVLADNLFLRQQDGGVWRLVGGFGVDVAEPLSFGASLSYWRGALEDDQFVSIQQQTSSGTLDYTDRLTTSATLDGISLDVGLLGYVADAGRLAFVIHSPAWMRVSGDGEKVRSWRLASMDTVTSLFIDDHPRLPWAASAGGSFALRPLLLSGELRYTAWEELDVDELARLPGQPSDYKSKLGVRAGVELLVPGTPMRLRGGYAFDPLVYDLFLGNPARVVRDRHVLAAGAGLLVAGSFALDAAFTWDRFERADAGFSRVVEKRAEKRAFLSGAYRF